MSQWPDTFATTKAEVGRLGGLVLLFGSPEPQVRAKRLRIEQVSRIRFLRFLGRRITVSLCCSQVHISREHSGKQPGSGSGGGKGAGSGDEGMYCDR